MRASGWRISSNPACTRRRSGWPRSRRGQRSSAASTQSANAVTSSAAAQAAAAIGIDRRREPGEQMTPTHDDVVLPLPPNAPRVKPNRFTRWLGRTILKVGGWRMVGELPDIPRLVLIGAPHSSNWDGVWGFAAKIALGVDI